MKRWIVLAAGVIMQMVFGGVYAWSAFTPGLVTDYGLSRGESGLIFGMMIAVFTTVMIPAGRVLGAHGPRVTAATGAVLYGLGYVLASVSEGSFPMLLAALGLTAGAGVGFGYICPLSVCMKWFPRNMGLVTGVSVAGFGGGAIVLSAVVDHLFTQYAMDVMAVFRIVGIGSGMLALVAALLLSEPEQERAEKKTSAAEPLRPYLLSAPFLLICLGMFCGTFSGLLVVGNLKPLAMDMGLSNKAATLAISLFAVGNAGGRILWGQVHDRIGSRGAVLAATLFLGAALAAMRLAGPGAMLTMTVLVGAGFGACFVIYASAVVRLFGLALFPRLYPICFLGYGLAALIGPAVGGMIADAAGSYNQAIVLSAVLVLATLPVFWFCFLRHGEKIRVGS